MNKIKKIKALIIIAVSILFLSNNSLKAQQYNTIYWMKGIPQHVYSNPAHITDAGIYIGTPGLSSIYFGFGNSGFKISDLLVKDINNQDPNNDFYWDEANFLSSLSEKNLMQIDMQYDILAFGFKLDKNYFHFNFSEKVGVQFGYPKDFFLLALEGNNYFLENEETGTANFDGLALNAIHYSEFALGYSRTLDDKLDIGLKAKVLFGHANARLHVNDFRFVTNPETFDLGVYHDLTLNTSLPVEVGPIDIDPESENDIDINFDNIDPLDYGLNTSNLGFAFDIGGVYKVNDKFTVALSVLDLGYIKWNSGLETYNLTGEIEYDGIDAGNLFEYGRRGDGEEEGDPVDEEENDMFGDLLSEVDIAYNNDSYSLMLTPKFFVSGKYDISDIHNVSLLARGSIFENKLYPSFSFAYNIQPIRPIGFSLSYSVINYTYTNVGFGMHLNLYPFQLYLIADNVFPAIQPHTMQYSTVHLGINWVIGYREKKDPARPMCTWSF